MSQNAKETVRAQGNLKAHEITHDHRRSTVQFVSQPSRPGHTYCPCGKMLPGASDEVAQQVTENVESCFHILTTSTFVFKIGSSRVEPWVAATTPSGTTRRKSTTRTRLDLEILGKVSDEVEQGMRLATRKVNQLHSPSWELQTICHVGNKTSGCKSGLFQDADFAGDLTDSKSS